MAKKDKSKKNPILALEERLRELQDKRVQAYNAGVSGDIITQLDTMIAETQLDLYTEVELQKHRAKDDDGQQWIV